MDWLGEKRHNSNMLSVLQKRETGLSSPAKLYDVVKANRSFVQRLRLDRRLEVHRGCVNTICWNESGTSVLSGSDDQHLVVSDPYTGRIRASIRSGHHSNIFCAKFLPSCQDQEIVSCSGAGSIYYTQVEREDLYGKCLFDCHTGTTYELVVVPNEARTFLSCGEDGTVRWYDLRIKTSCSKERCKEDVLINCRSAVTSISVDPILPYQLATACADGSVRVFDRRMLGTRLSGTYSSRLMTGLVSRFMAPMENQAHRITSLNYSPYSHYVLVSYSAENVYLFNTQIEDTKEFSKAETEAEARSCVNGDEASATAGADSGSQPPTKRLRLRGDWSDTGPNARPERERAEDTEGLPQVNLMQRMSDMLTRWLDGTMRRRGDDPTGRSTSPVGGAQEGEEDRPGPPQGAGAEARPEPAEQREGGEGEEDNRSTAGNREQREVAGTDVGFDVGDVLEQRSERGRGALARVVEREEEGRSQVGLTAPASSKEGSRSGSGGGGSTNTQDRQLETAQARTVTHQAEEPRPSARKSETSVVHERGVTGDDSRGSSEVRRGFSDTSALPRARVQSPLRSQSEQCVVGTPRQEEGGTMSPPFSDISGQVRAVVTESKSIDLPVRSVSSSVGQNSGELGKSGPTSSHRLTASVPPDRPTTASGVDIAPKILPDVVPLQDSRVQAESRVDPAGGSGPVEDRAEGSEGGEEGRGRAGHLQDQGSAFTAVTASQGSQLPGLGSLPSGQGSQPSGQGSQPSGQGSQPSGQGSQPSGQGSQPSGQGSHMPGQGSQPSGQGSQPSGQGSHMPGQGSQPSGQGSQPSGQGSQSSGQGSQPSGQGSHLPGQGSQSESSHGTSVTSMTRLEPVISLHYSAEGTTASTIQVAYASFNIMDPHPHPAPPSIQPPPPPQGSAVPPPHPHSMPSTPTTLPTSAQITPVSACRAHSAPVTVGDAAPVSSPQPVAVTVTYPGPPQASSGLDSAPGVSVGSEPGPPPAFSPSGGSLPVGGDSVPAGSVVSSAGSQTVDSPQPCGSGQGLASSDVSSTSVTGTAALLTLTQSAPSPPGDEEVNRGATCQTDHPTVQQDQVTASDEAQASSDPDQRPPPPGEASADTAQEHLPSASSEAAQRDTTAAAATTTEGGAGRQRRVGHSGPPTGDFQLVLNEENEDESDDEDDSREGIRSRSVPFWSYGASSNDERHYAAMCMQSMYRRRMEEREKQAMASVFQPQPLRMYSGHRNSRTMIKESNFWGDHVVMSGSDCGRIFMWDRDSTQLIMLMEADRHVVNCLQPHPFDPILASSGIDYDVKIWSPLDSEPSFDTEVAEEVMRRNQIMLEETRDTITVPAAFMLRVLASLNQIRAGRAGAGAGRQQDDSPADSD